MLGATPPRPDFIDKRRSEQSRIHKSCLRVDVEYSHCRIGTQFRIFKLFRRRDGNVPQRMGVTTYIRTSCTERNARDQVSCTTAVNTGHGQNLPVINGFLTTCPLALCPARHRRVRTCALGRLWHYVITLLFIIMTKRPLNARWDVAGYRRRWMQAYVYRISVLSLVFDEVRLDRTHYES